MVSHSQTNYSPSLQSRNARETSVDNWLHFLESRNFQAQTQTQAVSLSWSGRQATGRKFICLFRQSFWFRIFSIFSSNCENGYFNLKQILTMKFWAFLYFSFVLMISNVSLTVFILEFRNEVQPCFQRSSPFYLLLMLFLPRADPLIPSYGCSNQSLSVMRETRLNLPAWEHW